MARYLQLIKGLEMLGDYYENQELKVWEFMLSKNDLINSKQLIKAELERSKNILTKMRIRKLRNLIKSFLKFFPGNQSK
jgi:hypothetical protein